MLRGEGIYVCCVRRQCLTLAAPREADERRRPTDQKADYLAIEVNPILSWNGNERIEARDERRLLGVQKQMAAVKLLPKSKLAKFCAALWQDFTPPWTRMRGLFAFQTFSRSSGGSKAYIAARRPEAPSIVHSSPAFVAQVAPTAHRQPRGLVLAGGRWGAVTILIDMDARQNRKVWLTSCLFLYI